MKQKLLVAGFTITLLAALAQAFAATPVQIRGRSESDSPYSTRPIRLLVGLPPGGSVDLIARIVATQLGDALGQQVVVDNRTGASGLLAGEIAAHAPPDGNTLLFGASFYSEILALVQKNLRYDPIKDFAPISLVTKVPNVLVVHSALPVKTVSEFISHAQAYPGKLNYASSGNGSSAHLAMEMLKKQTGIRVVHVPYTGAPQALVALLAGEISVMFGNVPAQISYLKSGKTRALAITSAKRNFQLPNVPTMIEAGVPGFEITVWYGVFAPAGVPQSILTRLNAELVKTLNRPEIKERMAQQGAEPAPSTRQEFAAFQKSEIAKWTKVVSDTGAAFE